MAIRRSPLLLLLLACSKTPARPAPPRPSASSAPGPAAPAASASQRVSEDAAPSAAAPSAMPHPAAGFELGDEDTPDVKLPPLPGRPRLRAFGRTPGTRLLSGTVSVRREAEYIFDSRRLLLETNGNALEGLMSDERGMPTKVTGQLEPDGAFALTPVGRREAWLAGKLVGGKLSDLKLLATLPFSPGTPKPRTLLDAVLAPFAGPIDAKALVPEGAAVRYEGFIGERPVMLRLAPEGTGFAGELRFARGESHAVRGSRAPSGEFTLEERRGDTVLGGLTLLVATETVQEVGWMPLVGTYTAPGGESGFVALERNASLEIETRELGDGRRVEPHFASYLGESCKFLHEWPVVSGDGTRALNRRLAALSMLGLGPLLCDEGYNPTSLRPYLAERSYRATPVGKGLFGLLFERTDDGNGAHEMVSRSCYLVDAGAGRVLDLARALVEPVRTARLVTQKLLRAQHVKSLAELRNRETSGTEQSDPAELVSMSSANVCPVADGVEVSFDPYVLGPWSLGAPTVTLTRTEAKGQFVSDRSIAAWLR